MGVRVCVSPDFRVLQVMRVPLLLFWLLALGAGVWYGPKFLSGTKDEFDAPAGTDAYVATQLWRELYPHTSADHSLIVLVRALRNESLIAPVGSEGYTFALGVDTTLRSRLLNQSSSVLDHASDYLSITSYFSVLLHSPVPSLAGQLVSADQRDLLWTVSFNPNIDGAGTQATRSILRESQSR